jgi:hypothetical protein
MYKCFTSNLTSSTYCLNTTKASHAGAQAACASGGGHLVTYSDVFEQRHVERYFLDMGFLLPGYHRMYWMGLQVAPNIATWPNFTWVDQRHAIYSLSYQNWGEARLGSGAVRLEPNNLEAPEDCAGGNLTMVVEQAAGWADAQCSRDYISICEIEPPSMAETFTSQVSGVLFWLNQTAASAARAEAACNANGGRLASYASLAEQAEVEQYFLARQKLLPDYHKAYWLGLRAQQPLGPFAWADFSPGPGGGSYSHWGFSLPDYKPEPDNASGQELCAAANASQRYDQPEAWGWSDARCSRALPFMCRAMPPGAYVYVSNATNATYVLNTSATDFTAAGQLCNDMGGYLAAWTGTAEQAEVERYFAGASYFVESWHRSYWLGVRQAGPGGDFYWVDPRASVAGNAYSHWAEDQPDGVDSASGACAAANSSYVAEQRAYMWSDADCGSRLPFVCKIMRGWPAGAGAGLTWGHQKWPGLSAGVPGS